MIVFFRWGWTYNKSHGEQIQATLGDAKTKFTSLQKKCMANREHALGSDHALRSVTDQPGFEHFHVYGTPGRLGENEERFTVDIDDIPGECLPHSDGMVKRSCIGNMKTGETCLEVCWGEDMPSIWKWSDQGNDAWPHMLK